MQIDTARAGNQTVRVDGINFTIRAPTGKQKLQIGRVLAEVERLPRADIFLLSDGALDAMMGVIDGTVVGWDSVTDEANRPIQFEAGACGRWLPGRVLFILFFSIFKACEMSAGEAKNSQSPPRSASSPASDSSIADAALPLASTLAGDPLPSNSATT